MAVDEEQGAERDVEGEAKAIDSQATAEVAVDDDDVVAHWRAQS